MKNSKWFFLVASVIILGVVSCKKGDTGPAGPAGPAGANGAAGAAGPDSVITSTWETVAMTDTTVNSNEFFFQEIPAPGVTENILDNGVVLLYFGFLDNNNVTNVFNAGEAVTTTFSPGNIEIISNSDWSGYSYRYVVIPGTLIASNSAGAGTAQGLTKAQLQKMSYGDVKKLLGNSIKIQ